MTLAYAAQHQTRMRPPRAQNRPQTARQYHARVIAPGRAPDAAEANTRAEGNDR